MPEKKELRREWNGRQTGFSILEMLIAIVILLAVTGIVMSAMMQMMKTQGSVANRTEMHSSVRSATELLQQEIGQAGRITLPPPASGAPCSAVTNVTLCAAVAAPLGSKTMGVSSAAGMFNNEKLVIDSGDSEETVTATSVDTTANTITAIFTVVHPSGASVRVSGAFASGIVPKSATNGSGDFILKLYGDVNDDGNMVYVEYTCDSATGPPATGGNLYRNVVTIAPGATKPAVTSSMIILSNVLPNPPDPGQTTPAPCFKYQEKAVTPDTYVVDVAVTLTVQTQNKDPQTNQFQTETKALLNVSPRNVFDGWELASAGVANRIQPMPATVTSLLP
jgi:type II secretory pathway pseudopilin PulG